MAWKCTVVLFLILFFGKNVKPADVIAQGNEDQFGGIEIGVV